MIPCVPSGFRAPRICQHVRSLCPQICVRVCLCGCVRVPRSPPLPFRLHQRRLPGRSLASASAHLESTEHRRARAMLMELFFELCCSQPASPGVLKDQLLTTTFVTRQSGSFLAP